MNFALNDLTVLFLSILLEALPFLLLGSLIASIIGRYLSEEFLYRIIPRNRFAGLAVASVLGLVFPVCDCTVIPVVRRLIRKGLPPSMGITFMCAVPIVNPAVIASTAWAFSGSPMVVWLRFLVGLVSAVAAGYLVSGVMGTRSILSEQPSSHPAKHDCACGHAHHHDHASCAGHGKTGATPPAGGLKRIGLALADFIRHATDEFLDNAALITLGALLSAGIQTLIPRTLLYPVSHSSFLSVSAMMAFTYVISLCSNADAFVAKSFHGLFTTGSVVAFMTFGQMVDLKNTVLLLGFFRKRFVAIFIVVVAVLCLAWGILINSLGVGS